MKRVLYVVSVLVVNVFLANICIASDDENIKAELDVFWAEMSRSVEEGDFASLTAAYHVDAVLVSGSKKTSYPVSKALNAWKQGLEDTAMGKMTASVDFRFTRRWHDENTAHETGIFHYTANPEQGQPTDVYIHFEALLVKRDGWKQIMEFQKGPATEEEWAAAE